MAHVSPEDRDVLILSSLGLVTRIAGDFRGIARRRRIAWDDLLQEGRLGLILASENWNPDEWPDRPFGRYARLWILGYICRLVDRGNTDATGVDLGRFAARVPRLPVLEPYFGPTPFDPFSRCTHGRPVPDGWPFVCMRCFITAWEDHPALRRDPSTDPKREPKPTAYRPAAKPGQPETRRMKRLRIYGAAPAQAGPAH